MESTVKVRGFPARVSGRAGVAIPLSEACSEAGVELEIGKLAIRRMSIFAMPDATGIWLVSPAAIAVLARLGRRQRLPGVMEVIA